MAEDVVLKKFFPKKYKGFFVDVGCFHPVKYNNTYAFYKRGWTGVNVDIGDIKIEGFNWMRPKDTNVCCAVSNDEGELHYWSNGFYTPTITMDEEFVKSKEGAKYQYVKKTINAKKLTTILNESKYKDRQIDLLSVDVEGHDYYVLKSLDFEKYRPKVIAVETQFDTFEQVQQENTYLFLLAQGYQFVNWVGMTLIFKYKEEI